MYRGFNPGPIDGGMGNRTRNTLRQFQQQVGSPATGESRRRHARGPASGVTLVEEREARHGLGEVDLSGGPRTAHWAQT